MAYTFKEFLGNKTVVSEAYVQERINTWRPGRYDISKAPDTEWDINDPELIAKYQADWDDIHGNMGVLPKDTDEPVDDRFLLLAAEKVRYMKRVYSGAWIVYKRVGESKSNRDAAAIRMEEALNWASVFSHIDKEKIRSSWNHTLETGKWTDGYVRFKVCESYKDGSKNNSLGKERIGGRACK